MQIISLPLFALFLVEVVISVALTAPVAALRNFMVARVKSLSTGTAAKPVLLTLASVIFVVFFSSMASILRNDRSMQEEIDNHGHAHRMLRREADNLESSLLALLSGTILVLSLLIKALATKIDEAKRLDVNLQLLKRQAESNIKTMDTIKSSVSERGQEEKELVGKLEALQKMLEEADRGKVQAVTDLTALKAQSAGLAKEYDRLLAELDETRAKLEKADPSQLGRRGSKKDE